jgi:hypothetical protein
MLRKPGGSQQVEGKIVIDMRNGEVWGFPTLSGLGLPYPVGPGRRRTPVSEPVETSDGSLESIRRLVIRPG